MYRKYPSVSSDATVNTFMLRSRQRKQINRNMNSVVDAFI